MKDKLSKTSYLEFNRKCWMRLRNSILLEPLTNKELSELKCVNNKISTDEINKIYLLISGLLNSYIKLNLSKQIILKQFLGVNYAKVPYVIGIAGSVAVGKSTMAHILQILLSRWPECSKTVVIATDNFLYSNQILNKRGLTKKKGFPQTYDMHRLIKFISDVKSGAKIVTIPIYSHVIYDIFPKKKQIIKQPDILILEGLNILQAKINYLHDYHHVLISDFIDFSIYVDAPEHLLKTWYIARFLKICKNASSDPKAYFYEYSKLKQCEAIKKADAIWKEVNKVNLEENILPFKERADLIITKGSNHLIKNLKLKK